MAKSDSQKIYEEFNRRTKQTLRKAQRELDEHKYNSKNSKFKSIYGKYKDKISDTVSKLRNFLPVLGLTALSVLPVKSANADGAVIAKNITLGFGTDIEYNFKSPFLYETLNQNFRKWIPDWRNIDAGSSLIMPELKASLEFDLGGFKITPSLSNKFCNGDINYNETYNALNDGKYAQTKFTRIERFDIRAPAIGVKIGTDIMKDTSIYFGSGLEFISVSGEVDYTMKILSNNYTQLKKSSYSGSGIGFSIDAGLEHKIFDNFSAGFSLGRKFGNVNAAGKERTTQSIDLKVAESDYSQQFDFNNSYLKFKLGLRF